MSRILIFILLGPLFFVACIASADPIPPSPSLYVPLPSASASAELSATPVQAFAAISTTPRSPTATPSPIPLAEHRIAVRYVNGIGEFYDKVDNSKFVPRGMNYVRVDHIVNGNRWHSTFDPDLYDSDVIDQALHQMEADGYNVVRVFIDCCSASSTQVGNPVHGLYQPYMEKVVDFLQRAKQHHIYVILITDGTPAYGGYNDLLWPAYTSQISGNNPRYLTGGGFIAKQEFEIDFVKALIELQAPMDAIFAYDLTNEVHFETFEPPFSLSESLVIPVNDKTYDMAKPEDKVRMASDNLIYWIDNLRQTILQLDPTALVEVSFFSPLAPIPSVLDDSYVSVPGAVIAGSQADFIELHPYPGKGYDLREYAVYYGIDANTPKPILMGEFGVWTRDFNTADSAAQFLQNWQIESCRYGYDGWLLWTWDTEESEGLWNALSQNGEIEKALAPINHPDPCK